MAIATSYAPDATAYAAPRNASAPVAQKFSTRVTGLPTSCSGRASAMPLMPDIAVPSQYAAVLSLATPADANASFDASMRRSSAPLSQCSPNGVHPMPTIATRSRMPLDAMSLLLSPKRSGFPEVVVDAVGGEQPPERHLHTVADRDRLGVDIGELATEA